MGKENNNDINILIVDDNPTNIQVLTAILQKKKYNILTSFRSNEMNKIIIFFIVALMAIMVLAAPVIADPGNKPIQWRANLATDANILHKDVFPGIDLIYSGNQQRIEATFIVNPNADPDAFRSAKHRPLC